jgi:WS/DGAT/MGAT family acyltransferase
MPHQEKMSSVDSMWFHMDEPNNHMVITGVMWWEQPVPRSSLVSVLRARLVERFWRFRARVVPGHLPLAGPSWEEVAGFDVSDHVEDAKLPAPADEAALQAFIGERMGEGLDPSRPLWRAWYIADYAGGTAIVVRFHHCIADGIAMARVLLSLADGIEPAQVQPCHCDTPRRSLFDAAIAVERATKEAAEALARATHELLSDRERRAEVVETGAVSAQALQKVLLIPSDESTVLRGALGRTKRAAWTPPFALDSIKAIGRDLGATCNDVLLSLATGALRRHLRRFGDDPSDVRAFVPVNLRPLDGPIELGNHFGLVILSLPVGIADPMERMAALKARMDAIKDSPEAVIMLGLAHLVGSMPYSAQAPILRFLGSKASAVMTNVPGPRERIHVAGHPVSGILFWVPQAAHVGVGLSIFSYAGQVRIGVAGDAHFLPDPATFLADFADELRATQALGARAKTT